ncbi:hypothetical protein DFQ26_002519 [Actinomortierella ambigua]|nr:hypothetical protein DFQ26_002519 [Actinomortierella ambigua]
MSSAAAASNTIKNVTRRAPRKPVRNPPRVTPSKSVYLFRNIQTSQVLVSMTKRLERPHWIRALEGQGVAGLEAETAGVPNQNLKQIADETRRPPRVRHDHWHPMAAVQGFKTHQEALSFHNSLRDHQLNMTEAKRDSAEHMAQPKRLRSPVEMNQINETLIKMADLLAKNETLAESQGKGVTILWERPHLLKQITENHGVSFLNAIQHGDLLVHRGRDIVDSPAPKPAAA